LIMEPAETDSEYKDFRVISSAQQFTDEEQKDIDIQMPLNSVVTSIDSRTIEEESGDYIIPHSRSSH
ncbi:hypothetical protein PENTCL1PPCAC_9028, partial [Pristionchus entomophagus]